MKDSTNDQLRPLHAVVVHCVLVKDAKVFLLRRQNSGFADGYFALPGGYWEEGESLTDAVVRECFEECGVELETPRLLTVMTYRREGGGALTQGVNFVFTCDKFSGQPHVAEPERFDAADFFDMQAPPNPLIPWTAELLLNFESINDEPVALAEYLYPNK